MKAGTKEYRKAYYEKNKEQLKSHQKRWQTENAEYLKEKRKIQYDLNPDEIKSKWNLAKKQKTLRIRTFLEEYKNSCSCKKCGENRSYVLDFHHLEPTQKDFNLGDASKYSLKRIKNELEKCVALCRNCHSEFHYLENKNNITIEQYLL